jgi:hypothetical protein
VSSRGNIDGPAISLCLNQFDHLKGVAQSLVIDDRDGVDLAQFVVDGVGQSLPATRISMRPSGNWNTSRYLPMNRRLAGLSATPRETATAI